MTVYKPSLETWREVEHILYEMGRVGFCLDTDLLASKVSLVEADLAPAEREVQRWAESVGWVEWAAAQTKVVPTKVTVLMCSREGCNHKVGRAKNHTCYGEAVVDKVLPRFVEGPFNPRSPIQLQAMLYDMLGAPIPPIIGTGPNRDKKRSTDYEALTWLLTGNKMTGIATVLRHRDVARSLEFLLGFQDLLVAHEDGTSRLHPDLKRGTITGRLACRDPNLQQVPSYEGDLYKTREIFVPPPGHKLIVADYSALEYFIAAHIHIKLFGDRKLADNLATIHEQVAAFVFRDRPYMKGVRPEDIKNHPDGRVRKTRKDSKAIGYGTSYGAGPSNLGSKITDNRGIAIGPKAGEKLQNEYFEFLPAVERFQDWVTERVLAGKPVPTLGGRMLHYPANNRGVRQGLNAPLQGSGADIMDSAMIRFTRRVRELGLGAKLILNVHDELVATAPESQAEETREVMQWAMCGAWDLEIPLEAEAKIGDSWAEAK